MKPQFNGHHLVVHRTFDAPIQSVVYRLANIGEVIAAFLQDA
jgi:hypothetical protein